jgi:hypothetical protein
VSIQLKFLAITSAKIQRANPETMVDWTRGVQWQTLSGWDSGEPRWESGKSWWDIGWVRIWGEAGGISRRTWGVIGNQGQRVSGREQVTEREMKVQLKPYQWSGFWGGGWKGWSGLEMNERNGTTQISNARKDIHSLSVTARRHRMCHWLLGIKIKRAGLKFVVQFLELFHWYLRTNVFTGVILPYSEGRHWQNTTRRVYRWISQVRQPPIQPDIILFRSTRYKKRRNHTRKKAAEVVTPKID